MSLYSRFDRHAGLVGRMADTIGADLVDAATSGQIPETAFRSVVLNCMSCDETDACEHWLEDHRAGSDVTPDYCRNKALLEKLGNT